MKHVHDEDELVREIARHFPRGLSRGLGLGIGDDAALWKAKPGFAGILTSDWFLEVSHFLLDKHPAESVGWKCLARAASDIAAMGGAPRYFLLNLALPAAATGKWLKRFLGGLRRAAGSLDCVLAGGDTTRSNRILISITVIGEIPEGQEVLRSGARAGDLVFVSGTLGEAEHGLQLLRKSSGKARPVNPALRKHLYPEPRVALGRWLAGKKLASSMMDLSDGLSSDLPRLCAASGVGAVIHRGRLPVLRGMAEKPAQQLALHGGDDYELLFTISPRKAASLPAKFRKLDLTQIGEITRERGVRIMGNDRKLEPLPVAGWDPFRQRK
jgi:thiamine-monophosphate kinase